LAFLRPGWLWVAGWPWLAFEVMPWPFLRRDHGCLSSFHLKLAFWGFFSILPLCSAKFNLKAKLIRLRSEARTGSVSLRKRRYDLAPFFLPNGNIFIFPCFAMHCVLDSLSNLFDLTTKVDGSMHLHFQVQALLIRRSGWC